MRKRLRPGVALLPWLAALCAFGVLFPVRGDELGLDELLAGEKAWWNPAWTRRISVTIDDPQAALTADSILLLDAPSPLWLYNTAPCSDRLADLRAVGPRGEEWPAGVLNFGGDDGTSRIWVERSKPAPSLDLEFAGSPEETIRFTLYYGNPAASPSSTPTPFLTPLPREATGSPAPYRAPVNVKLGPEEYAPDSGGFSASETRSVFFENAILLEGEDMRLSDGTEALNMYGKAATFLKMQDKAASDHTWLAPFRHWDPEPEASGNPVTCIATVDVSRAGQWTVHVRYVVASGSRLGHRTLNRARPFLVAVGDREYRCGKNHAPGALFRYDSFPVVLQKGSVRVEARFSEAAGLDCILFSADPSYQPDIADVNGPVWMRFRIGTPGTPPFHVELFCVETPMSVKGSIGRTAAMLFRESPVSFVADYRSALRDSDRLLRPGEWSAWGRALHSRRNTWWSQVLFRERPAGSPNFSVPDKPPAGDSLENVSVDCAFATRPDARRVFRIETNCLPGVHGLHVHMPTRLTLENVREQTQTFGARARFRFHDTVRSLDLSRAEPPRDILLATDADTTSFGETRHTIKILGVLGFNCAQMTKHTDPQTYWRLAETNGISSTILHHWIPGQGLRAHVVLKPLRRDPAPEEDCRRAVLDSLAESARAYYSPRASARGQPEIDVARARLITMGDEIHPAVSGIFINRLPLLKGWFHAYLRDHGQTPESFGETNWNHVAATGDRFDIPPNSDLDHVLTAIDPALKATNVWARVARENITSLRDRLNAESTGTEAEDLLVEEQARQAAELEAEQGDVAAALEQKRLHYWTQRFRSHYTARFYAVCSEMLSELESRGRFHRSPLAAPNFQAAPMHSGKMWDGALNLFEWGRLNATRFLLMEDWTWDPYRVAWGMTFLRAVARKNSQQLGTLLVGGGVTQRYMVDLGNGVRGFLAYRYGPLARIGPAWADSPGTLREWAELSRMTARWESHITGATNRPAETAILVDNTADINARYLDTSFRGAPLFDRVAMFIALIAAGIPVEVVGAKEVLHDNALSRYKALYVSDPHIDLRIQEKIRDWVADGGVLWASYAAAARQEYDEPSDVLEPVFGITARPPLSATSREWEPGDGCIVTVEPAADLPAADLPAVTFRSVPLRPEWRLGAGAETLARFADGTPAFIRNRHGKGRAFLLGSVAWQLSGGPTSSRTSEPPDAAARRELVAVAARAAGIEEHLRLSHPRVLGFVHDGPQHSIVYLANTFTNELPELRVAVKLRSRPGSAHFASGEKAAVQWSGDGWARVTCPLGLVGGEMIVFDGLEDRGTP